MVSITLLRIERKRIMEMLEAVDSVRCPVCKTQRVIKKKPWLSKHGCFIFCRPIKIACSPTIQKRCRKIVESISETDAILEDALYEVEEEILKELEKRDK